MKSFEALMITLFRLEKHWYGFFQTRMHAIATEYQRCIEMASCRWTDAFQIRPFDWYENEHAFGLEFHKIVSILQTSANATNTGQMEKINSSNRSGNENANHQNRITTAKQYNQYLYLRETTNTREAHTHKMRSTYKMQWKCRYFNRSLLLCWMS